MYSRATLQATLLDLSSKSNAAEILYPIIIAPQ